MRTLDKLGPDRRIFRKVAASSRSRAVTLLGVSFPVEVCPIPAPVKPGPAEGPTRAPTQAPAPKAAPGETPSRGAAPIEAPPARGGPLGGVPIGGALPDDGLPHPVEIDKTEKDFPIIGDGDPDY